VAWREKSPQGSPHCQMSPVSVSARECIPPAATMDTLICGKMGVAMYKSQFCVRVWVWVTRVWV
jgi:hypothetical protein